MNDAFMEDYGEAILYVTLAVAMFAVMAVTMGAFTAF